MQVVTKPIAVLAYGGTGLTVRVSPNVLNSTQPVAQFSVQPAIPLGFKVSIYTVSGELTRVIRGTGTVTWDSTGTAKGLYIVMVELTDTQGQVDRQVQRMIVQ